MTLAAARDLVPGAQEAEGTLIFEARGRPGGYGFVPNRQGSEAQFLPQSPGLRKQLRRRISLLEPQLRR